MKSVTEEMAVLALNTVIRAFDSASPVDAAEFASLLEEGGEALVILGRTLKDGKVSPEELDAIVQQLSDHAGLIGPFATFVRKAAEQIL
jgi:hypothetical protein